MQLDISKLRKISYSDEQSILSCKRPLKVLLSAATGSYASA
ncbi:MAG: hypothetical protein OFPI_34290 [Osedax symbiont Rs2]|nr:MAG: hypothetical protein OFPI_34290 [Osedax symbiont Rs2]